MEQEIQKLEETIEQAKVRYAFCIDEVKKMEAVIAELEMVAQAIRTRSRSNGTGN